MSYIFANSPFNYSFAPIPSTSEGGYFIDNPSKLLAVNKYCDNLDMTNEFMRFLVRSQSLNEMSSNKRQVSPAKVLGEDKFFNSFKDVLNNNRVLYYSTIGLSAEADFQVRKTFDAYFGGETIDGAIGGYGSYKA